jgi:serine/threonine-protein kinase
MSPEQAAGDRDLDGRSDIYGLACVLYEMLSGQPPFTARSAHMIIAAKLSGIPSSIRVVRPDVSATLDDALLKALERDPANRFASAREFGARLSACAAERGEGRREKLTDG